MSVRASTSKLVPIVVVLVALLFFFHGSDGGFQTMNGPTSTLKECGTGLLLQALILLLAHVILGTFDRVSMGDLTVFCPAMDTYPLTGSSLAPLRC